MLDFDKTIGLVLDFAQKDGNTLVIITADHETGGLTLPTGDIKKGEYSANFSTKSHTGVPVPVYAFGPGAENFRGFMENSSLKKKIENLLKLK
jgi:alkaline phosphatase